VTAPAYPEEKLLFRRQFILGPRFVETLPGWTRVEVRDGLRATVHPDLAVTRVEDGRRALTLFGFLLDPSDPTATDRDVLARLAKRLGEGASSSSLVEATHDLGGRWILIVDDGASVLLLNDAMGMRTVFYTDLSRFAQLWCASQPGLLAETLGLAPDPEAQSQFVESSIHRDWPEWTWPGDRCLYREVRHLLPNHLLELTSGVRRRYWPDRPIGRRTLAEGAEESARLLRQLVSAAGARFPLALATTAGWDTRLILAASREVAGSMSFFTHRTSNLADLTTAPRLLARLGLTGHQMLPVPETLDPEFGRIYFRNVTDAHEYWGRLAQGMYGSYPDERVCLTANAFEITRTRIRLDGGEPVTARALARWHWLAEDLQERLESNAYVVAAWEEWLAGVGELLDVHVLDLFYWEHYSGNFAAIGEAEHDIITDFFTPPDCRRLLTTMLAVDERYRDHDDPRLYVEMVRRLWPEALREPVNEPYEGPLGPVLRAIRTVGVNRLVPKSAKAYLRRFLGR
jgi:hypothetical protein